MSKDKKEPIQTKDITRKEARLRLQAKEDPNGASPNEVTSTVNLLHELQVHQIELEMQQNELIVARDSCEAAAIRYQALYDFAPVAFFSLNHSGHITQTNLTAASMMGIPRAKVKGLRLAAYLTEDSLSQFNSHLSNVFKGLNQPACEINLCFDHKVSTVQMMMSINDDGLECLTVLTDITVQREDQDKLIQKELEQRDILNAMVEAVISIDQDGRVLTFNKSAENIFGYPSDEIIGEKINRLMPTDTSYLHDVFLQNHLQKGKENIIGSRVEVLAIRKNRERFPMQLVVEEMPQQTSGQRRFIGSCTDLTEIKRQEVQLQQAQKMDALGKLTSGVAHDFNNMLGIVLGYSDLLARQSVTPSKQIYYAEQINRAGKRGAALTRKLLSFARAQPSEYKICNINSIINTDFDLLSKTLTASIDLKLDLAEGLWLTKIDLSAFEDILLNMSINSMHAMSGDGALIISTANENLGNEKSSQLLIKSGDYVSLSLTDTGCGMSDEIMAKIFEPFFTTKEELGTGLGLAQVKKFILEHGGAIEVKSDINWGTQFKLYFPRDCNSLSKVIIQNKSFVDSSAKTRNILVVDDENALAEIAKNFLEMDGYHVETLSSGAEALLFLENHQIDLMITDVIMPKMSGFQLAETVQGLYPNTFILFSSGYQNEDDISTFKTLNHLDILNKPYDSKYLRSKVSQILK
jgi:PAS domain S-box-containing protein